MMFNNTKYIIVDYGFTGEFPILFPYMINHSDVSNGYVGEVVSAGFVQVDLETGVVSVFGKSDSLKIESRPEDAEIIKRELNKWKTDY